MTFMKKIPYFMAYLIFAAVLLSCSTADKKGRKFALVEKDLFLQSGKSIAVVSGCNNDNDFQITKLMSDKLSASGKFKVLPQSQISKMVPMYPLNYNIIDFSATVSTNLSETSRAKIDSLQKSLKTDYILVIWISDMATVNRFHRAMILSSRLISYPEGNVVGYSDRLNDKASSVLFQGSWEELFEIASNELLKEVLKNTK